MIVDPDYSRDMSRWEKTSYKRYKIQKEKKIYIIAYYNIK